MDIKRRWIYRLRYLSFGLTPNNSNSEFQKIKEYILEDIFACVFYGKLSFQDTYNMPVQMRRWWVHKTANTLREENRAKQKNPNL